MDKDFSMIKVGAQAGYPYAEPMSPNIDVDMSINMYRQANSYKVEVVGSHNRFPYYEMMMDGVSVYQYNATDFGPGLLNLNESIGFKVTQYYPIAQKNKASQHTH